MNNETSVAPSAWADRTAAVVTAEPYPRRPADGEMLDSSFYPSVIRSAYRLTYTIVSKIIEHDDSESKAAYRELVGDLERLLVAERIGQGVEVEVVREGEFVKLDLIPRELET